MYKLACFNDPTPRESLWVVVADSNNLDQLWELDQFKKGGLICDSCPSLQVESQTHVLVCDGYQKLRQGLDLNKQDDLIKYFREVLVQRDKM